MTSTSQTPLTDPCVIVGAACRVPGAANPHALWDALEKSKDLQQKMPRDRYNADAFYHPAGTNKGTTNATLGYYLDQGIDQFDAPFFSISGKEAEAMDPQQRLLLEVVYEALENAGITLDEVRGSQASVFAGSFTYDYESITHRDLSDYPKYSITGLTKTILANRVSFFYDLHGPSVQVDTACSSSLTCLHLGAQSLQNGESDIAIICGSALHFDPTIFVTMTDFGMLSTDGRCRHLDAGASGYVRGDGICAVILKKQRAAEMNGDNIRAIIRGSGANHDGTKEGITLPNPIAQADLVRAVYATAGLSPKDTGYFEAHGTGTKAGDPREAQGIGAVFAPERTEPLYVGSIKTNIGHLEGASGLASVIKTMMSVEFGKIVPNMHFNTPNPEINFEELKIRVAQEAVDWNPENGIRRASVNSFGFGGSNAHVILENYHQSPRLPNQALTNKSDISRDHSRPFLLPLTSHSENAGKNLQKNIARYIDETPGLDVRDLVYSYGTRRTLHSLRAYAIGRTSTDVQAEVLDLRPEAKWKRSNESPRLGFVFTGQGAQLYAMGRELIVENSLFRQVLTECEAILQSLPDAPSWSLLDELTKSESSSRLSQSEFSQPLCTALQIALVDLLKVWDIEPTAVVGHSSGEIAAAYAASILSRRDAMICAYYRGLYMSKGKNGAAGSMMAVGLTEVEAALELEQYTGRAGIAAINSPSSITLSGDKDAILEIKEQLDARKVFARILQVEQAFHSHHMLPLAPGFEQAIANTEGFSLKPAKARMFSSVTARDSSARPLDCTYWSDNMTGRVRFSDALIGMALGDDEDPTIDILVEIGPHAALRGPSRQTIKTIGLDLPYVASLNRKLGAYESMLACAGELFSLGYQVNLTAVNSDYNISADGDIQCTASGEMLTNLPTYSWDHKSYWAETRRSKEYRQRTHRQSLLGAPVPGSPSTHPRWQSYLRNSELAWMSAHIIDGKAILPGAAYFAMAVEAIAQTVPSDQIQKFTLSDVQIKTALSIPNSDTGAEVILDLALLENLTKSTSVSYSFMIYSFTDDGETIQNCKGTISATTSEALEQSSEFTFAELQSRTLHCRSAAKFYERLFQVGLQYGEEFRLVSGDVESAQGFAIAPLTYIPSKILTADADACIVHPTFLDSAIHIVFASLETKLGHPLDDAYVPTFCRSLSVSASMIARKHEAAAQNYWVASETNVITQRLNSSDIAIHDENSNIRLVDIQGLELTALGLSAGREESRPVFFRIRWKEAFNCLGISAVEPKFGDLDDLLACYAHQYPESKILHVSSESQLAEEGDRFDLLIVADEISGSISDLLKPNGFVISTTPQFAPGGLQPSFHQDGLTIWQASAQQKVVWPEQLTLLLGLSPSEKAISLAHAIQTASSSKVTVTNLHDVGETLDATNNFVSLVALDEDILVNVSSQYLALRNILCMPHKNFVWFYKDSGDEKPDALHPSLISGLARTARSENESLRLVTLELPLDYVPQNICDLTKSMLDPSLQDDEFVFKDGRLVIPRIEVDKALNRQVSRRGDQTIELCSFRENHVRLVASVSSGSSKDIVFEEDTTTETASLAHNEIEIAVEASSLTRADIITSCIGTVIKTSPDSETTLQKGDRVFALSTSTSSHTSILRTKSHMVVALDDENLMTAASIGIPLLNAYYAIHVLARLRTGDICLVHDAMTITGQLAIQILRKTGVDAIASVQHLKDREYLRERFGLLESSIFISTGENFVDLVNDTTAGRRCHLLLNCSTVSATPLITTCLAASGLLVEFADQLTSKTEMVQRRSNVTSAIADLAAIFDADIQLGIELLKQSFKLLNDGTVTPLEHGISFPYSRLSEAFQSMQADPGLERVVLYASEEPITVRRAIQGPATLFVAEKTYLIVGGLGGLGRILAQWMFRKGARKFAFLARSGATRAEAISTVQWLQKRRATVNVYRGDVIDNATVHQWVNGIEGDLGGVFQGAVKLQSGPLSEMTTNSWQAVIDPKVKGSLNLHNATLGRHLDFFICFSSILAIIGFMSEANYSAANGFMDNFVTWRHKQGLPGASINIGVVADAGLIAENKSLKAGMDRIGMDTLSEEELLFQFEQAVLSQYPHAGQSNDEVSHQLLSGINVSTTDVFWSSKPLFRKLYAGVGANGIGAGNEESKNLALLLRGAERPEKMKEILTEAFVDKISSSLSISIADIHTGLPLSAYGMDSLVAVDFRGWFSKEVGVDLALFDILGSKTTGLLIDSVCKIIATEDATKPDPLLQPKENAEKPVIASSQAIPKAVSIKSMPDHIPLSSFQTRLWFMDNMMEEVGGLSIGMTLLLEGEPQLERINQAFHQIANRNETLRTRYFEGDGFAQQEVLPVVPSNIQYIDISKERAPMELQRKELEKLQRSAMDLEKGEVFRSALVKLGDAQYAWLFSIHHIAIDGGSRESFMEQIISCYNDVNTGKDSSATSTPKLSYVDFTLWHEDVLKSPRIQSDLAWWKQQLTDASPISKLMPFAQCDRPEQASVLRRTIESKIDMAILKRMKRICSGIDVTPFHFILTALRTFVFRYTSEEDLTILIINGERPHSSFERIIGFFVNVIPLRWKDAFEDTFENLLLEAKNLVMGSMAHSQAPFDSIVETMDLGWNPQHFPLGQIALNYQIYAKSPKYETADFTINDVKVDDIPTDCEIQLQVMEDTEAGLDFTLDYDSYLYSETDMDRFLENFMTFIESAVRDFRQPIEEIEMCGQREIDFLRANCWLEEKSNRAWMDVPMWERFIEVVHDQPQSIAIKSSNGQSITYESLQKRAEEIATLLQSAGIRAGDRVGVLSHPSIDAIAAMLSTAILRCTYVPLDPNYAQGRIEYMIEDTAPKLILFGQGLDGLLAILKPPMTRDFLSLSSQPPATTAKLDHEQGRPEDIFYIVYTSGSTGKPKGIVVSHDNTRAMLCGRNQALDLSNNDVFLSQSSVSFDISITQTWGSFMSGATVALASNETKQEIEELTAFIRDAGITMTFFTPTQFAMMIEHCSDELRGCKSLRAASMIGERLHPRLVKAVYDLGIPVTVYNEYGPSETTSQNTLYKVPHPSANQLTIDVGRPLPNNSAYIVNSKLKPVPVGVAGELCLGGAQISLGYLGKANTSNPVFLRNPFVSGSFKSNGWNRLYRTGDLARFRQNGLIDLEGRISGDKQIKLRGNRIDLEEIESEIHRVSSVDESLPFKQGIVVIARTLQDVATDSLTDDRQLVAFIVTKAKYSKDEHQKMANTLHVQLSRTLNGYMVPAYYQMMERLETTLSGKIDRVKLRKMKLDPVYYIPSTTSDEDVEESVVAVTQNKDSLQVVKRIFITVLKLPSNQNVEDDDNFFSLGGQSVLALRLQKSLKEKLAVPVTLIDIFKNPTPAGLEAVLASKSARSTVASTPHSGIADIDWNEEIQLPNDKRYRPGIVASSGDSALGQTNGTLLIGADGFVGYYMLKYLLTVNPNTKVYLLSLGDSFNLGDLFSAFILHKLFDDDMSQVDLLSRTEFVQGSMGQDNYGLNAEDFDKLGRNVQSIYHTGGFVSLLATYSDLRDRNVKSMFTMIDLASRGQGRTPTSLHYISTWSVIHLQTWKHTSRGKKRLFTNEQSAEAFQPPPTNDSGYFKTRWVAEMLMEESARRGFPTTIYRCPAHTAPIGSLTATPSDNFTINLYLSMVQTGVVLRTAEREDMLESDIGMVPINYLADTIVRLANTKESQSVKPEALRLHISNPNSIPYSRAPEVIGQVRDDHIRGKLLDVEEWFKALAGSSSEKAYLEWATYKEYLDKGHLMFTIDDALTRPLLAEIDASASSARVKCPPVDAEYLRSILKQEEMFNKNKR